MSSRRRRTVEDDASDDEVWSDEEDDENEDDEEEENEEGDDDDEIDDDEEVVSDDDDDNDEVDDDNDEVDDKELANSHNQEKDVDGLLPINSLVVHDTIANYSSTEEYLSTAITNDDTIPNDQENYSDLNILDYRNIEENLTIRTIDGKLITERQVKNQGSNNDESRDGRKKVDKKNPTTVPKGGKFFLHDDRGGDGNKNRRPEIRNIVRKSALKEDDNMWKHDKFVELYQDRSPSPPRQRNQQQTSKSTKNRINKFQGKSRNAPYKKYNSEMAFNENQNVKNTSSSNNNNNNYNNSNNNNNNQSTNKQQQNTTLSTLTTVTEITSALSTTKIYNNGSNNNNRAISQGRGRGKGRGNKNNNNNNNSSGGNSNHINNSNITQNPPLTNANSTLTQNNSNGNNKSNSTSTTTSTTTQPISGLTNNYTQGIASTYHNDSIKLKYQTNNNNLSSKTHTNTNTNTNSIDLKLKASAPEFKPSLSDSDLLPSKSTFPNNNDSNQYYHTYNGTEQSSNTNNNTNTSNSSSYKNLHALTSNNSNNSNNNPRLQEYTMSLSSMASMTTPYPLPQQYTNYPTSIHPSSVANLSPYSDHLQSSAALSNNMINSNISSSASHVRLGSGMTLADTTNYSMSTNSLQHQQVHPQQQPLQQQQVHLPPQQQPMISPFPAVPPGFSYTPTTSNISNTMMYANRGVVGMVSPQSPAPIGSWFTTMDQQQQQQQNLYSTNSNGIPMYYNNQLQQQIINSNNGNGGVSVNALSNLDVNAKTFRPYGYQWG